MEAESYSDQETADFINQTFIPLEAHIKEHPAYFKRFDAVWTPTILIMDSKGVERSRIEGYLPKDWFRARLEMGVARISFMHKKFADAQKLYSQVVDRFGNLALAAEAAYWRAVSQYKATNDHTALGEAANGLADKFPEDEWRLKSLPWAH